jgi:hypothetical protein
LAEAHSRAVDRTCTAASAGVPDDFDASVRVPRIGVFTNRRGMLNELLNQYVAMFAKWRH